MILPYPREPLFLLSATPSYFKEPGADFWDEIPWSLRSYLNSPKRYSPLRSNRGDLILLPRCIPTSALLSLISQKLQTRGASVKCIHCLLIITSCSGSQRSCVNLIQYLFGLLTFLPCKSLKVTLLFRQGSQTAVQSHPVSQGAHLWPVYESYQDWYDIVQGANVWFDSHHKVFFSLG